MEIKVTERGWPGHFIMSSRCVFRRNTLVECGDTRIVVSTVGNLRSLDEGEILEVGCARYYETQCFHAVWEEGYWEADVSRPFTTEGKWTVNHCEQMADQEANDMHEDKVKRVKELLEVFRC